MNGSLTCSQLVSSYIQVIAAAAATVLCSDGIYMRCGCPVELWVLADSLPLEAN